MKHLRLLVSMLTVWVFLATSGSAAPPTVVVPPRGTAPPPVLEETTPIHHVTHGKGPIVVNWHFVAKSPGPSIQSLRGQQGVGGDVGSSPASANLIVNPDGTSLYSGNYKHNAPGYTLSVMLALKSTLGGTIFFVYTADAAHGIHWSKQAKSTFLKDEFKTFTGKHDWAGSYRFELTSRARRDLQADCRWLERIIGQADYLRGQAQGWGASGVTPSEEADYQQTCGPLSK